MLSQAKSKEQITLLFTLGAEALLSKCCLAASLSSSDALSACSSALCRSAP